MAGPSVRPCRSVPFKPRCGGHPGVHLAVGGAQGEGRQVATDGDLHLRAGAEKI